MEPKEKKKLRPERELTDESLRAERKNTDQAIADKLTDVEQSADEVVERAREQADAVLDAARDKADLLVETAKSEAHGHAIVARERALEDEVLRKERATADESLRSEREEQARALAALLPLEREKTDRYLLTERARSDDALAHRDDFMGMVSHDLRNLLSGIVLSATLVSELAPESDEGRQTVSSMKRIERYAARMNRLIGDLIDVVSIDAGKLSIRPARSDATALLTEAVDAFSQAATEKGISLECGVVTTALLADFDHDRMLQVLANLITNAIKFTPRGGTIVIRGESAGGEIRFSVSDTGAGIPATMLETIFERFWQVSKNDQRGLGLGLYISRCIVLAHQGKIWAESELGEGSVFHFTIPGAPQPTA